MSNDTVVDIVEQLKKLKSVKESALAAALKNVDPKEIDALADLLNKIDVSSDKKEAGDSINQSSVKFAGWLNSLLTGSSDNMLG